VVDVVAVCCQLGADAAAGRPGEGERPRCSRRVVLDLVEGQWRTTQQQTAAEQILVASVFAARSA
jgi:hypothetical protein